jgi:alpha-ketoglutarate-dependent taurine dioxygenase
VFARLHHDNSITVASFGIVATMMTFRTPSDFRFVSLLRRSYSPARVSSRRQCTNAAIEKEISTIPWQYLRAMDSSNFDPQTRQRNNVAFNPKDGKPIFVNTKEARIPIASCSRDGSEYHVVWTDGLSSRYSVDWIHSLTRKKKQSSSRILWTGMTEEVVRGSSRTCMSFPDVIHDEAEALHALYRYGFVLITGTPIDDDGVGVAALASALGGGSMKHKQTLVAQYRKGKRHALVLPHGTDGPLRTLYGTVWSTSSAGQAVGASTADSSYGSEGLPLHTDLTYYTSPPGLQIFTMVQPAGTGGASLLADGFAVAAQLREQHAEAFAFLSRTPRRYRCIDREKGWHLQACGPVIQVDEDDDEEIIRIRHNDLDRLPDLPSKQYANDADTFYHQLHEAHEAWNRILADDAVRLVLQLQPGDSLVVANQVRHFLFLMFDFHVTHAFTLCVGSDVSMDASVLKPVPRILVL